MNKEVPFTKLVPGKLYVIKEKNNERTLCLRFQKIFECNGTYASFRSDQQAANTLATGFHVDGHTFFDYDELINPLTSDVKEYIKTFLHT
jgi:hypothetical protein